MHARRVTCSTCARAYQMLISACDPIRLHHSTNRAGKPSIPGGGEGLLALNTKLGIQTDGYSPLGTPDVVKWNVSVTKDPTLTAIAVATGLTNAQVTLTRARNLITRTRTRILTLAVALALVLALALAHALTPGSPTSDRSCFAGSCRRA